MDVLEMLKIFFPLIILQLGLVIYVLFDISRNGVKNLNKVAWVLIAVFVNTLGPVLYLIFGRGDGDDVEN